MATLSELDYVYCAETNPATVAWRDSSTTLNSYAPAGEPFMVDGGDDLLQDRDDADRWTEGVRYFVFERLDDGHFYVLDVGDTIQRRNVTEAGGETPLGEYYCGYISSTQTFFASVGPDTEIATGTGLIKQSTFTVDWNNVDDTSGWSNRTAEQYNKFKDGELQGTMTLLRDSVNLVQSGQAAGAPTTEKTFRLYSALNTGESQRDPVVTDRELETWLPMLGHGGLADVTYGSVEQQAIEDKYHRYSGRNYARGLNKMIDAIVQKVVEGALSTESQYNFRKIDSNEQFREENTTVFSGEEVTTEGEGGTTTTSTMTTTTTEGY